MWYDSKCITYLDLILEQDVFGYECLKQRYTIAVHSQT